MDDKLVPTRRILPLRVDELEISYKKSPLCSSDIKIADGTIYAKGDGFILYPVEYSGSCLTNKVVRKFHSGVVVKDT